MSHMTPISKGDSHFTKKALKNKTLNNMKKLHKKGGKVHPSPPPQSQPPINHLISLLPATILTLTAALSPEDKVVLAYLISCSSGNTNTNTKNNKNIEEHGPRFKCNCFRCYISYWVRWDTSPNRELIHEIIEEYEEGLFREINKNNITTKPNSNNNNKKKTRSNKMTSPSSSPVNIVTNIQQGKRDGGPVELVEVKGGGVDSFRDVDDDDVENGSLSRIVSFLGEKIWSVWN
ncbi:hypothetical protein ACFE04_016458 [Oxalis oulophora]